MCGQWVQNLCLTSSSGTGQVENVSQRVPWISLPCPCYMCTRRKKEEEDKIVSALEKHKGP